MTPLAKLDEIAALEKGWDGDDAEPISRRTVEAARSFLAWWAKDHAELPSPGVFPTACGGVDLDWYIGNGIVSLIFEGDEGECFETRFYIYREGEIELNKTLCGDCPICREQVVAAVEGKE